MNRTLTAAMLLIAAQVAHAAPQTTYSQSTSATIQMPAAMIITQAISELSDSVKDTNHACALVKLLSKPDDVAGKYAALAMRSIDPGLKSVSDAEADAICLAGVINSVMQPYSGWPTDDAINAGPHTYDFMLKSHSAAVVAAETYAQIAAALSAQPGLSRNEYIDIAKADLAKFAAAEKAKYDQLAAQHIPMQIDLTGRAPAPIHFIAVGSDDISMGPQGLAYYQAGVAVFASGQIYGQTYMLSVSMGSSSSFKGQ